MNFKILDYRGVTILMQGDTYMVQDWTNDELVFYSKEDAEQFINEMLEEA